MCEGVPFFVVVFVLFYFFLLRGKNNVSLWKLHMGVIFLKYFNCSVMSDVVSQDDPQQFETL